MNRQDEKSLNAQLPRPKGVKDGHSNPDPQVWFGYDDGGHRAGYHVRDLAAAIRRGDLAEADKCLDLIGREQSDFADQVALGRAGNSARAS
jgi:arginyl-tRNA synthetase